MTTSQLIALLKEKDPSGQMRVFIQDENEKGLMTMFAPKMVEVNKDILENSLYNYELSEKNIGEKVLVL